MTTAQQPNPTSERNNHTGLRVLGGMLSGVLYLVGAIIFFVGLLFFRNCGTYVDTGIGLGEFLDRGAHVAGMFMIPFGALLVLIGAVFTWVSLRKRSSQISGSVR